MRKIYKYISLFIVIITSFFILFSCNKTIDVVDNYVNDSISLLSPNPDFMNSLDPNHTFDSFEISNNDFFSKNGANIYFGRKYVSILSSTYGSISLTGYFTGKGVINIDLNFGGYITDASVSMRLLIDGELYNSSDLPGLFTSTNSVNFKNRMTLRLNVIDDIEHSFTLEWNNPLAKSSQYAFMYGLFFERVLIDSTNLNAYSSSTLIGTISSFKDNNSIPNDYTFTDYSTLKLTANVLNTDTTAFIGFFDVGQNKYLNGATGNIEIFDLVYEVIVLNGYYEEIEIEARFKLRADIPVFDLLFDFRDSNDFVSYYNSSLTNSFETTKYDISKSSTAVNLSPIYLKLDFIDDSLFSVLDVTIVVKLNDNIVDRNNNINLGDGLNTIIIESSKDSHLTIKKTIEITVRKTLNNLNVEDTEDSETTFDASGNNLHIYNDLSKPFLEIDENDIIYNYIEDNEDNIYKSTNIRNSSSFNFIKVEVNSLNGGTFSFDFIDAGIYQDSNKLLSSGLSVSLTASYNSTKFNPNFYTGYGQTVGLDYDVSTVFEWKHYELFFEAGTYTLYIGYRSYSQSNLTTYPSILDALYIKNFDFISVEYRSISLILESNHGSLDSTNQGFDLEGNTKTYSILDGNYLNLIANPELDLINNYKFVGFYDNLTDTYLYGNGIDPCKNLYFSLFINQFDYDIEAIFKPLSHMPSIYIIDDFNYYLIENNSYYEYIPSDSFLGISIGVSTTESIFNIQTSSGKHFNNILSDDITAIPIDRKITVEITSFKTNYANSYFSFEIYYLPKLDKLASEGNEGIIEFENDRTYPFKEVQDSNGYYYQTINKAITDSSEPSPLLVLQMIKVTINVTDDISTFTFSYKISTSANGYYTGMSITDETSYYNYLNKNIVDDHLISEHFYSQFYGSESFSSNWTEKQQQVSGIVGWREVSIDLEKGVYTFYIGYYGKTRISGEFDDYLALRDFNLSSGILKLAVDESNSNVVLSINSGVNSNNLYYSGTKVNFSITGKEQLIVIGVKIIQYENEEDLDNRENSINYIIKNGGDGYFILTRYSYIEPITISSDTVALNQLIGYLTLEEALLDAEEGDIVRLINNYTLTSDLTINAGITLLLPTSLTDYYGYTSKGFSSEGTSEKNKSLYKTLEIPSNVTLNVYGTLLVNGITGVPNANADQGLSGGYSKILLDGVINVCGGGICEVFGIIEGNGIINALNNSKLGENFVINHWRGGAHAAKIFTLQVFPYNEYDLIGIYTTIHIDYNASYYGLVKMYASSSFHYTRFYQFDQENGIYKINSGGTVTITKTRSTENQVKSKVNGVLQFQEVSHNYIDIVIEGGASETGGSLNVGGIGASTQSFFYPIDGDMTIHLNNGFYLINHKIKVLPGAKIYVDSNSTLSISNNAELIFYSSFDDTISPPPGGITYTYPYLRGQSNLFLSGNLEINGAFGGLITCVEYGAKVTIGNNAKLNVVSREAINDHRDNPFILYSEIIENARLDIYPNHGYKSTYTRDHLPFEPDVEEANRSYSLTNSDLGHQYEFIETTIITYDVTYHLFDNYLNANQYTYNVSNYTILSDIELNNEIVKPGFNFIGYYLDRDFEVEITNFLGIYNQKDIYVKWEFKDIELDIVIDTGEVDKSDSILQTNLTFKESYYTLSIINNLDSGFMSVNSYSYYKYNTSSLSYVKLGSTTPNNTYQLFGVSDSGIYKIEVVIYYYDSFFGIGDSLLDQDHSITYTFYINIVIEKLIVDTTNIKYEDSMVVYDSETHTFPINFTPLENGIELDSILVNGQPLVDTSDLELLDVGTKNIKITYKIKEANLDNYTFASNNNTFIQDIIFEIVPLELNVLWSLDNITFSLHPQIDFYFNDSVINYFAKTILFTNQIILNVNVISDKDENELKNASKYTLTASLINHNNNVLLVNNIIEVEIHKKEINAHFVGNNEVTYDSNTHSLSITNQLNDDPLPEGISVSYLINDVEYPYSTNFNTPNLVNAGNYTISATFISNNYLISSITTSLKIAKANPVITTWPQSKDIFLGENTNNLTLNGESNILGTFQFDENTSYFTEGEKTISISFIPFDTTNYNQVSKSDYTLYAKKIIITFNYFSSNYIIDSCLYQSELTELPSIVQVEGYLGEYSLDDLLKLINITDNITINTIYTPITYTIDFVTYSNYKEPISYTILTDTFLLKDANKPGYNFLGYVKNEETNDYITLIEKGEIGSYTLYAKYEIINYSINYSVFGGINNPLNQDSYTILDSSLTFEQPSKIGYSFVGWYDESLTIPFVFDSNLLEDITIYAKYSPNSYYVYFIVEENSILPIDKKLVVFDTPLGVLPIPTLENYYFVGFSSSLDEIHFVNEETIMNSVNMYLYGVFTQNPIITFNTNGGTLISPISLSIGSVIPLPETTNKTGYTFNGWYKDILLTEPFIFGSILMPETDIVLYASWLLNNYDIYFDSNGGSEITKITGYYLDTIPSFTAPNKDNYTFSGWFSDNTLKEIYEQTTFEAKNITLYAGWTPKSYEVNYYTNNNELYKTVDVVYNTAVNLEDYLNIEGLEFKYYTLNNTMQSYLLMPGNQIDLFAYYEIEEPIITIYGYDEPVSYTNVVNLSFETNFTSTDFSFVYSIKKGDISLSNTNQITLINVSDSGIYTLSVIVYYLDLLKEKEIQVEIIINKAEIDLSMFELNEEQFTYDGNTHSLEITNNVLEQIEIIYFNNEQIDAGVYDVYAEYIYDTNNYTIINPITTKQLIISKRILELELINNEDIIYDNTLHSVSPIITNLVKTDQLSLIINNNSQIYPGTYTINVVGIVGIKSSNYALPQTTTFTFSIKKADITGIELEKNKEFTYDKSQKSIKVNSLLTIYNDTLNAYYEVKNTSASNGINAGIVTYQVTLTHPYYNNLILTETFVINKRDCEVVLLNQSSVYGSVKVSNQAYTINNIISGDTLSISIIKENGEDKGIYNLSGHLNINNANYNVTFINSTFEITPKEVIVNILNQTVIYSNSLPTINNSMYLIDSSYNITSNDSLNIVLAVVSEGKNAGTYQITGSYSNLNYNIFFTEGILTIEKKEIYVNFNNQVATKIYDKTPYLYDYTLVGILDNESVDVIFDKNNLVNAGNYLIKVKEIISDNYYLSNNNYQSLSLTIEKFYIKLIIDNKSSVFNEPVSDLTYRLLDKNNNIINSSDLFDDLNFNLILDNQYEHIIGRPYPIRLSNIEVLNQQNYIIDYKINSDYGIYLFTEETLYLELETLEYTYTGYEIDLLFTIDNIKEYFDFKYYVNDIQISNIINVNEYKVIATLKYEYIFNYKIGNQLSEIVFFINVNKRNVSDEIIIDNIFLYTGLEIIDFNISFTSSNNYIYLCLTEQKIIDVGTYTITINIIDNNVFGLLETTINVVKVTNPNKVKITYQEITYDKHSITIPYDSKYEYSFDGQNYSDQSYYYNLISGSTHLIYIRYKETNNYLSSLFSTYIITTNDYDTLFEKMIIIKSKSNILDCYDQLYLMYLEINHINLSYASLKTKETISEYEKLVTLYNSQVELINNEVVETNIFQYMPYVSLYSSFSVLAILFKFVKRKYIWGLLI